MSDEILRHIGRELHTQDNAATAHPVFLVEDEERIYGIDPDYDDSNPAWYNCGDEFYEIDHDEEVAAIEAAWQKDRTAPGDWERVYYTKLWRFVQLFFTSKGAADYIASNRHNLKHPRIYVASAYRNRELIAVREALMAASETEPRRTVPLQPERYDLSEGASFYQPEAKS